MDLHVDLCPYVQGHIEARKKGVESTGAIAIGGWEMPNTDSGNWT